MARRRHPLETWHILVLLIGTTLVLFLLSADISVNGTNIGPFWPMFILLAASIVVAVFGGVFVIEKRKRDLKRAIGMSEVDKMSGIGFEEYVGELAKFQGYNIKFTPQSNDFGVDLIAEKNDKRYSIQIKRYGYSHKVGRSAISDAVAGMKHYNCSHSMVVTNSFFTPSAKQIALSNDCELVDRAKLSEWILEFQKK